MDQKSIIIFVVGLFVGAILHHIFMCKQMKNKKEKDAGEMEKVAGKEVEKFGSICDGPCDTDSKNWPSMKLTCGKNYTKCYGEGWKSGRKCKHRYC